MLVCVKVGFSGLQEMTIDHGTEQDIDSWMSLVEKVKDAFSELEIKEAEEEDIQHGTYSFNCHLSVIYFYSVEVIQQKWSRNSNRILVK